MVKLRRAECGFRLPSIVRAGWVRVAEAFAWDLMAASPLWSPARPRRGPPGGQHERRPDEEAHCSEESSCVGQRQVDQGIGTHTTLRFVDGIMEACQRYSTRS